MCGRLFIPKSKVQRFCQNPHPAKCFNCEDDILPTLRNTLSARYSCKKKACRQEATRLSNLEKYGVENVAHLQDVKDKISQSRQSMTAEQQEATLRKARNTSRERYGTDYATQSETVKEKTQKTNLDHYGVDNIGKVPEFQEKRKKTNTERYGVEHVFQSEDIKDKIRHSNLQRYGVAHPRQHHEKTRLKAEDTNIERYGFKNVFSSEETKLKIRKTIMRKYGVEYTFQSEEMKELIRSVFMEKYGVDNPTKNATIRNKQTATNLERYGVPNAFQNATVQEKSKETMMLRYGVSNGFLLPGVMEKSAKANGKTISKINLTWKNLLEEATGLEFELEKKFGGIYHADLAFGNLLVDINPSITHNNTVSYPHVLGYCKAPDCLKHPPKERTYHQKRAKAAESEGKILLQYFDWFDAEIFIEMVKAKLHRVSRRVPAKKTQLREITQTEANQFFAENHLMGRSNKQTLCVGLFYDNELIHCQSYGPARFSQKAEWEAIRSCSKLGYQITGGFSKCDKYFFSTVNPESVVSYVDMSISQGKTDSAFDGWTLEATNSPSATWTRMHGDKSLPLFVRDSTARRVSADRILGFKVGEKYPRFDESEKKITNDFVFASEGYVKVYDAGTKTFLWRNKEEEACGQ